MTPTELKQQRRLPSDARAARAGLRLLACLVLFSAPAFAESKPLQMKGPHFQTVDTVENGTKVVHKAAKGDVLLFSYGVPSTAWKGTTRDTLWEFRVRAKKLFGSQVIFSDFLAPVRRTQDRGWKNAIVRLDQFEGTKMTLVFETVLRKQDSESTGDTGAVWGGVAVGGFQRRPEDCNIILVSLDTVRADRLSLYGHSRPTSPNLDSIAKAGVWFEDAISESNWTIPSHMSLFTGLYPTEHNVLNPGLTEQLAKEIPTLAELLRQKGYVTQAYTGGGYMSARSGLARGFLRYEEFARPKKADGRWVFTSAVDFISRHKSEKFFLFVHTYEAHSPYRHRRFVTGDPKTRLDEVYDSGVFFTDRLVGALWERVVAAGLAENTLLIVVSDHGEQLNDRKYKHKEHGHTLYDELVRIPMIFHFPGRLTPRKISGFQAQLSDVFPTVLDFAGVDRSGLSISGESLKPLLEGQPVPPQSDAISEAVRYGERDLTALRRFDDGRREKFIFSPSAAAGKSDPALLPTNRRHGYWREKVIPSRGQEFYDLIRDPQERVDLAPSNPPRLIDFRSAVEEHLRQGRARAAIAPPMPAVETLPTLDATTQEQLRSLGY